MEDFNYDFLIKELYESFKLKKQALRFHLKGTYLKCDFSVLDETWEEKNEVMEEIALRYTGKRASSRVSFEHLKFCEFEELPDMQIGIQADFRNYIFLSSLNWLWGLNNLPINHSDGIRALLNAICLLDRCMGIIDFGICQVIEDEKKANLSNGGKAKASRYAPLKAEVIRLLYMKMPEGGWRKKSIAIGTIHKDLIAFIEKNNLLFFSDKQNIGKDTAELYAQLPRLIEDWTRDDMVVRAVIDAVVIKPKKSAL